MQSLKRLYFNLAAGLAKLTHHKTALQLLEGDSVANRVSRDVNYYRTHFFNL